MHPGIQPNITAITLVSTVRRCVQNLVVVSRLRRNATPQKLAKGLYISPGREVDLLHKLLQLHCVVALNPSNGL